MSASNVRPRPWRHLLPRLAAAGSPLLALLDFDGTLSDIVARPDDAALRPGNAAVLQALASWKGKGIRMPGAGAIAIAAVGVVSGRALDDVSHRVGIPGLVYAGNHGLEIAGPGICYRHPAAEAAPPVMTQTAARLTAALAGIPGVLVENKGITLTLHYRRTPGEYRCRASAIFYDAVRPLVDAGRCRITAAKAALELRPAADWHKGRALGLIRARLAPGAFPLYIGDDATDEDAFRAAQNAGGAGVRVGARPAGDADTDADIAAGTATATAAGWRLASPAAVTAALSELATLAARRPGV